MSLRSFLGNRGRGLVPVVAIVVTAAAGGVAWLLFSTSAIRANPDDAKQVAMGERIYAARCAACHGANLEGQPNWRTRKPDGRLPAPPHDATGHTWHHPDAHLFRLTRDGLKPPLAPEGYQSDMPAFAGVLSDSEIWAVIAFIKSKWPPQIQARQSSFNERAKQ